MEYKGEGSCPSSPPPPPLFLPDHQGVQGQPQLLRQEQHSSHPIVDEGIAAASAPAAGGANESGFVFPAHVATVLPWTFPSLHSSTITTATTINDSGAISSPIQHDLGCLCVPPPPPPTHLYGDFYTRKANSAAALQFGYDGGSLLPQDHLGLAGLCVASGGGRPEAYFRGGGMPSRPSSPFCSLQSEFGKMTAQEIMDAKALAATKSHSEAERRRRERINNHLARLRSLLPSTTKTDKASLLAEVIQHVKELKRQTSQIVEENPVPTESDELTVDATNDDDGKFVVKASICCDDRSDLLSELIKALKALRLRALKAEITTLGGRVKNVLVVTGEHGCDTVQEQQPYSVSSIQEALKAVMERSSTSTPASEDRPSSTTPNSFAAGTSTSTGVKRQRTTNLSSILENRSI